MSVELPILKMRKPGFKKASYLAQGYTMDKWQNHLGDVSKASEKKCGLKTLTSE